MKLKYFIRGLGIGIIFGAIVMLVAYNTSDKNDISDAEIIERAEKLGMVMSGATETDAKAEEAVNVVTEDITEAMTEATTEAVTETTEVTTEAVTKTTEATTEEVTETTTERDTEVTTEKKTDATTEKTNNSYTESTITVTRGMGSTEVAGLLQQAGIIEDAADFDSYLVKQGISNKIQINTYKFNSNMSYEDIATELTTPKNN